MAFLQKQVAQLEALIQTKLAASPDLLAKVNRLRQVQGIGVLTATSLVALMPELGSLSDTQAAALAGVASFKTTVVSSAVSATSLAVAPSSARSFGRPRRFRHNPVLRPLYLRLITRGKAKKLALTALMRKLIVLANHLLKNPDFIIAV